MVEIAEVIKEYIIHVDELEHAVKSRIVKIIKPERGENYRWEISHNYKPSEGAAGVYYPSTISAGSFDDAESLMLAYVGGFTNISVKSNEYY